MGLEVDISKAPTLQLLERLIEKLDKMSPQDLAVLFDAFRVDPSKAKQYAILERIIRDRQVDAIFGG